VCVRWDDPGTFKATRWLSLDQIRDHNPGNTLYVR
jgi:hypothetical protein